MIYVIVAFPSYMTQEHFMLYHKVFFAMLSMKNAVKFYGCSALQFRNNHLMSKFMVCKLSDSALYQYIQ